MKNKDNLTIVTSIPECYTHQDFFETTELFIKSVRRFHPEAEIIVIVPLDYNFPKSKPDIFIRYIKFNLKNSELLMSNVVLYAQDFIKTDYFIYFTTENILLNPIQGIGDNIHVVLTEMVSNNTYFEFEKTIHKMYNGLENINSHMILEYAIGGKTNDIFWKEFNTRSVSILEWILTNKSSMELKFNKSLYKYILPAADLVSLNLLYEEKSNDIFVNIPHGFISMHPGLTEKFKEPEKDSIFYQYSGLYHNNIKYLETIKDENTKCWLAKELLKKGIVVNTLFGGCKRAEAIS